LHIYIVKTANDLRKKLAVWTCPLYMYMYVYELKHHSW